MTSVFIMEGMSQLDCLLEKHKQLQERSAFKSSHQLSDICKGANSSSDQYQNGVKSSCKEGSHFATGKVYVNPNYAPRKPAIHVNPRLQGKSPVYVNPKLFMQTVTSPIAPEVMNAHIADHHIPNFVHPYMQSQGYMDVDPRLITQSIPPLFECSYVVSQEPGHFLLPQQPIVPAAKTSSKQPSLISNSRHNPTDLVSIPLQKFPTVPVTPSIEVEPNEVSACTSKENSNMDPPVEIDEIRDQETVIEDNEDSNLIALSKRKLVRIRKLSKSSATSCSSKFQIPLKRRISLSGSRKMKANYRNIIPRTEQSDEEESSKFCNSSENHEGKSIPVDNNVEQVEKNERNVNTYTEVNCKTTNLISIDGVMYRSSRNQLVRSSPCLPLTKRKRSILSNRSVRYFVTQNGKKLQKVDSPIKNDSDSSSLNSSLISHKRTKSHASHKVKQKSLQILRNKTRKSNQPCLLFQRFGHCANQFRGTCFKVHDRNQVALCRNFLQGKCLASDCRLSHNVGPEKMPTCKYFLDGCCCRDACPYLHVKVPSKNPICLNFLRGYCPQGNECLNRHIRACPEFDKSGKCSKGKSCPYPHKSPLTEKKKSEASDQCGEEELVTKKTRRRGTAEETVQRYYEKVDDDLGKKRDKLLKRVQLIKDMHLALSLNSQRESSCREALSLLTNEGESSDIQDEVEVVCNKSRPPLGPLPAYIPID